MSQKKIPSIVSLAAPITLAFLKVKRPSLPGLPISSHAHQVHRAIGRDKLQPHLRTARKEGRNEASDRLDHAGRAAEADAALRFGLRLHYERLGLLGFRQDCSAPLVQGLARIGDPEAPARPLDQTQAQPLFQPRNAAAELPFGLAQGAPTAANPPWATTSAK